MRRSLLIAAIMAASAGNLSSSPQQSSSAHKQEVAQQPPANPSPVTVVIENAQRSEPASSPAPKPPSGNTPAEWALVVVGIITCGVIGWQAWESRKAAQAMRQSTAIQQAQLVQWVAIEEWSGGEDIWLYDEDKFLHHLMFVFYIVNPTNYPMSLSRADWVVGKQQGGIAINESTFPPRGRHSTIMEYQLTPEEFEVYRNGKLRDFNIEGSVTFVDVSKMERRQKFSVTLNCAFEKGVVGFKPYKTSGWEANRANKKVWEKKGDGQNPN
jgi:hypothetical protein